MIWIFSLVQVLVVCLLLIVEPVVLKFSTYNSIDFLSCIASFQCNVKWVWNNHQFTNLKKSFNNKRTVHTYPSYDCIWKRNGKTVSWWSYHYLLPKLTCTTQVGANSFALCVCVSVCVSMHKCINSNKTVINPLFTDSHFTMSVDIY